MLVDPILAPMLQTLPPFPDHIEDWDALRAQELVNAEVMATQLAEPAPEGANKESFTIPVKEGSIEVHVYTPPTDGPHPAHLYFHGGGWVGGTIHNKFIDIQMKERCIGADCVVICVEYRKAPEHPFPTGLEDCYAALLWACERPSELGIRRDLITVGGGSAGGNLAAAVCLKGRDESGPAIAFQLLEVPALDLTLGSPSIEENAMGYGLTAADLPKILGYYLSDPGDAKNPYASPLLAPDLSHLPPAYVITAEFDPIRDDGARYAERLQEANVPVTYSMYEGQIHISSALTAILPAARAWRDEAIDALKAAHRGLDRV
jgi:acetyl esterase